VRAATPHAPRLEADTRARATIGPIIRRLGVDALVGRMTRLCENERFKAVTPESAVLLVRGAASAGACILVRQESMCTYSIRKVVLILTLVFLVRSDVIKIVVTVHVERDILLGLE
jgi:hypothetical protein